MNNVFAYTAPGSSYPEYLSLNVDEHFNLVITVRGEAKGDGSCGETVNITLTPQQVQSLARTLFSYACTSNA